MKIHFFSKKSVLLMTLFVSLSFTLLSQSPEGINYQAVMRNGLTLAANQNINIKFELKKVNSMGGVGALVYAETHNVITNNLGIVNLAIGEGTATPNNVTNFDLIDWGSDQYFLATSVDFTGGTNFQFFGEQRLLSVPYALYSKEASSITGGMPDISTDGTAGNISINNGSTLSLNVDDADADAANELNTNIQLNGNNLEITDNGGTLSEDLSPLLGTDDQSIQGSSFDNVTNNLTIGIENGNSETIDLSGLANSGSDDQNIQGSSFDNATNNLTIGIENGTDETIDLSDLDNSGTDDQNIQGSSFDNATNNLTIGIENGTDETIDLSNLDNSGTDDQNIQGSYFDNVTNNLTIGIENGTDETIDLSNLDNSGSDDQQLTLNQNTLTLEDGGTPIDLTQYLDNTDNQQINTFNFNPTNNIITLDLQNSGGPQTVDLSALNVNDNDWSISGSNIYRNSGNVGIGTPSPIAKLHLNGGRMLFSLNDATFDSYINLNNTSHDLRIQTGGTTFASFNGNRSIGLGLQSNDYVGVGTNSPTAKLEVNGQVKITGGSPGANKVLTSDANGLASWQPAGGDTDWTISGNNVHRNSGNVGVGTTNPTRKLHIENDDNAYSAYFNNTSSNSSVTRYGIWNVMSNQASGASTAFRNSNYIGSSNNATNYGIRNEFSSQGSGVSYGISSQLNLINHSGGSSQIGIYSFLLGGSNTSGNTYGVWVNNMTLGSGTDYGIYTSGEDYNYFQGNVGIGVSDPDAKLEVNGQVKITGGSPGANKVLTSDANGLASWQTAGDTDWTVSGNNVYRNSGNVGVGTSGPSYKLHVVGRLKTDGITESSDVRLKKDIYTLTDALKRVQKLRGVSYQWKEIEGRRYIKGKQIGFIAQEVEEIIPELVDTDNEGFKSIQYSHLVPLLVESIKTLSLELDKKDIILNGLKADLNTKSDDINELQEMLKYLYKKMDIPYSETNKNIANE